jgi:molybdopterin-guanine dinucleotide biosynthesis protein A
VLDAAITAGGRLIPPDAQRFGTDIKALVRVNGRPLLDIVVSALRAVPLVARIVVVGPISARPFAGGADQWIEEFATGEQNLLAALRATQTPRIVISASDLPFVTSQSYVSLIEKTDASLDAGYPIFTKDEFLKAFPGVPTRFASLADGQWTGGSAFIVNREPILRNSAILERGFGARKSLASLAALLGPKLLFKFVVGRVRVEDVEARVSSLLGARIKAVRGADPALAMDCDGPREFEYVRAESAG